MRRLTPWKLLTGNLARRRFRSVALIVTVAAIVGGVATLGSLLRGMRRSVAEGAQRFGADLVVVPRGAQAAAEGALIVGRPTQLTLPLAYLAAIRRLPGVDAASPQVFIKTLANARCCPGEFFLVGYDPRTDFTLAPWLQRQGRRAEQHEAIIGDRITLHRGDQVTFFGSPFKITGQLERTGVGLDLTVFIPLDGVREMIHRSRELAKEPLTLGDDEISVVLVKVQPDVPASRVAEEVGSALPGVDVVLAPRVIAQAVKDLGGVLRLLTVVAVLVWLLLLPVLAVTFSAAVAERRRDIGLWRALGANAGTVFRLVLGEAVLLTGLGGALGLVAAGVLLGAFGQTLAEALGTPYLWPGAAWFAGMALALLVTAVGTGAAAAWVPARAAATADPYECIRRAGA